MIYRLLRWLGFRAFPYDEYFERFVEPQIEWGKKCGVPESVLNEMVHDAIMKSDGLTGAYPGVLLRDAIQEYVASNIKGV